MFHVDLRIKQQLFPYTVLSEWFLLPRREVFTVRCEPKVLTTNHFSFHLSRVNALNMGKFLIFMYDVLDGPLFIIEQG